MIKGIALLSLATMQATQCKTAKVDSLQIWTHVGAHPAPGGWSYPSPACHINEVCSWEHEGTPPSPPPSILSPLEWPVLWSLLGTKLTVNKKVF